MKTVLLLFAFVLSAAAQEKYQETDFYVKDKMMEWSHVYNTSLTAENSLIDFQKNVLSNFVVDNFQNIDGSISFTISEDKIDVEKYGETHWSIDLYVSYPLYYFVRADFKDFKYKILITQIESISILPRSVWKYNELLDKNFKIKEGKRWSRSFKLVNDYFLEKFTIKEKTEEKW